MQTADQTFIKHLERNKKKKKLTARRSKIRNVSDCSETTKARRKLTEIFKVFREKKKHHQPRILYPGKLSLKTEGGLKTFTNTKKLK